MTEASAVEQLNRRIAEGDPGVVETLASLPSRCIHDDALLTPFSAAIRHDHAAAIELLVEDEEARAYCPALDKHLLKQSRTIASMGTGKSLEAAERYLLESNQTVDSIAAMLGYYDGAAFRKAFRRWTGMSPADYRARSARGNVPAR